MKHLFVFVVLLILVLSFQLSYASDVGTADTKVDEIECHNRQIWRLINFDPNVCKKEVISQRLQNLKANCPEYFNVKTITPLTAGEANDLLSDDKAFGYSFTYKIIIVYECK